MVWMYNAIFKAFKSVINYSTIRHSSLTLFYYNERKGKKVCEKKIDEKKKNEREWKIRLLGRDKKNEIIRKKWYGR